MDEGGARMNQSLDHRAFVAEFTKNNPVWWTPRESKPVDAHSGVAVEYKSRQQKWRKVQVGERGFAFVDGEIIEVYVLGKERLDDRFSVIVMPALRVRAKRHTVDIDHYSRARGRLVKKIDGRGKSTG